MKVVENFLYGNLTYSVNDKKLTLHSSTLRKPKDLTDQFFREKNHG